MTLAEPRDPGLSVRLRLTLAFALVAVAGGAVLWLITALFVLRYIPVGDVSTPDGWSPNRDDIIRVFTPRATLALGAVAVLGLAGGWFLSGVLLRPLRRLEDAAERVRSGDLATRVALPGRRDEFRDVADAFDAMLDTVQAQMERERRFAADASHELRTPLASMRSLLEVAQANPDPPDRELLSRLQSATGRAAASTDALLLLARLDRDPLRTERVDLSLTVEQATEDLLPLIERTGADLSVHAPATHVRGDPDLLLRLTSNLLHNAVVHGAGTPTRVWVTLGHAAEGAPILSVGNTGAHLDAAAVATFTGAFVRGEGRARSVRDLHVGAGLGLAICASIVDAHGGSFVLSPRPTGGLVATVVLPPEG